MSNWLEDLENEIVKRNQEETYPFVFIYNEYNNLWKRFVKIENARETSKHLLHTLEHDVHEHIQKKDYHQGLVSVNGRIETIQTYMQQIDHSKIDFTNHNINKLVFEQKRLLQHQTEEIVVAKKSLQESIDLRVQLENELKALREERIERETYISKLSESNLQQEKLVQTLRHENENLTSRLIEEKQKTANQINEMNQLIERKGKG
jgi:hypothetical protein